MVYLSGVGLPRGY